MESGSGVGTGSLDVQVKENLRLEDNLRFVVGLRPADLPRELSSSAMLVKQDESIVFKTKRRGLVERSLILREERSANFPGSNLGAK